MSNFETSPNYKTAREIFHLMEVKERRKITRDERDALMVYLSRMRKKRTDSPKFATRKLDNNGNYEVIRRS